MKDYRTDLIRNVAIIGHGGEGKTTLTEAMLFNAGVIDRCGRVEDGTTTTDFEQEEAKRQVSISAAMAPLEWKDHKVNIVDVPGYFDFIGEMSSALSVVDGALIVLGAVSGMTVGAEKAWAAAKKSDISMMILINQMDRENADFAKTLEQLKERFGTAVAPIQWPIVENHAFKGYINLIDSTAKEFAPKQQLKDASIPSSLAGHIDEIREMLIEAAASADDALMEKYFEEGELSPQEIVEGLRKGILEGTVIPVVCAAAQPNMNVNTLLDCIVDFMPSPIEHAPKSGVNPKTNAEEVRPHSASAPFSAQVFKTIADPFVGKISIFRVYSGTLTSDMPIYNANAEKNEKIAALFLMRGKKQVACDKLIAGDIGAISKLQYTMTGHTLCDPLNPVVFPAIRFPAPSISLAVSAKTQGEEEKVFGGLNRLTEEDPTFTLEKQAETGDVLISGQGELHLEVIIRKLQNKFGVEAQLNEPKLPYRETIRKYVKAEGKHKKQSGGHGQYGHCVVEFEPITDGSAEFEFIDKIVGGVVPRQFIPAVEKGLRECTKKGVLAGYPMVNLRCTLVFGSYHSVDSNEMAFRTAARLAYKKGCAEANPALLEPIMRVQIDIPDEYMGDIIGDLNRRRGRVMGMNQSGEGMQQVVAEVPQSEMFKYATDLRSMTQARGTFTMAFERYEEVPGNIAAKVIAAAVKEEEEDE